jgi:alpha-beta hydrolase superfamily lysophospholipase
VNRCARAGGYPEGTREYLGRTDVQKALNLDPAMKGASGFDYHSSGPASITLHPHLAKKLRVLIYNGDADACVPYKGNVRAVQRQCAWLTHACVPKVTRSGSTA